ncbi:MAG: hypothetical protein KatS3mg111_1297 [Pirellulaceae bacterium]|nr:MAG: hypothetical protein KatS3mg111_1297 [Pirellulaceae bacterium]
MEYGSAFRVQGHGAERPDQGDQRRGDAAPAPTASKPLMASGDQAETAQSSPSDAAIATSPVGGATTAPGDDEANRSKLAVELEQFNRLAAQMRRDLAPKASYQDRCLQAFDIANDLFGHAPTWVCFYRELMGTDGFIRRLFPDDNEFGSFLRSDQYHQIQLMLTALRGRDLPENDPHDPQRMITVRLPKSLHEAMCEEAERLNISVNRLCITRMLQLLDPKMVPKNTSKPRGRKPRKRTGRSGTTTAAEAPASAPTGSTPRQ